MAISFLGYPCYSILKNSFYKYKFISYLSLIELFKSFSNYKLFSLNWKTFDSHLINGSNTIDLDKGNDIFHFFVYEKKYFVKSPNSSLKLKNIEINYVLNKILTVTRNIRSQLWLFNLNFFFYKYRISRNSIILSSTNFSEITDHKILYSNFVKLVDNYNFYGLEDYSLRVDYFNEYSMFQFLCLRYGFGPHLSNLYCKYMGLKKEFEFSRLNNYWHYNLGGLFLGSKSAFMDLKLASYVKSRHMTLISLNSRKGIRLLGGYPIYGQRTRSNANTSSKFPYSLQFKNL